MQPGVRGRVRRRGGRGGRGHPDGRAGMTLAGARDYDVAIVGGGFAGVTAARECALRGRRVVLLEARDRLGGRTWSTQWDGWQIEYGGAWVHWHQPHPFSEITRAGLPTTLGPDAQRAHWHVGGERREGTIAQRDAIAQKGWDQFVDGGREARPAPPGAAGAPPHAARGRRQRAGTSARPPWNAYPPPPRRRQLVDRLQRRMG